MTTTAAQSPSLIELDECPSTNSYLSAHPSLATLPHGAVVTAHTQSAGRGQRGNTWEAEPGKNVTMSMLLRPRAIEPRRQFVLSEIVSVSLVETLRELVTPPGRVKIKWPNDIYVDNRKICGILIEHSLSGNSIGHTIAGIGLNVNQAEFRSDAPNPVSLLQITGSEHDTRELTLRLARKIMQLMAGVEDGAISESALHDQYLGMLWRHGEEARYIDTATGTLFTGRITDVEPSGMLHVVDSEGRLRVYAFKEIAFVI